MAIEKSQEQLKPSVSDKLNQNSEAFSSYTDDPDVVLMLAFQKGDKASFEKLMTKYFKKILNFSYRFVNDRELAEDLTQEVFIRVYKSGPNYIPRAKFQTWLYTISKNICLNDLRKKRVKIYSLDNTIETSEGSMTHQLADNKSNTPDQEMVAQERKKAIQQAINHLPENQRVAVLLRRYEQMSYDEIAQTMKTTSKAVKSLLSRAKENLKDKLVRLLD